MAQTAVVPEIMLLYYPRYGRERKRLQRRGASVQLPAPTTPPPTTRRLRKNTTTTTTTTTMTTMTTTTRR
jgi:hypothetical protein